MKEFTCNRCGNTYIRPIPTAVQENDYYVLKYLCSKCGAEAYSEIIGDPNSDSTQERLMELAEKLENNGLFSDEDLDKLL